MLAIFHSVWTIVVLVIFLGIVAWAYSSKRNSEFDQAARMPMDDEEASAGDDSKNNSVDGNDNKNASDDNKNVSVDDTK